MSIGTEDAVKQAYAVYRRTDNEAIDKVKRGSGMIVCFDKGKGTVVNAAGCEWVAGLIARDPFVEKITSNVLIRLSKP